MDIVVVIVIFLIVVIIIGNLSKDTSNYGDNSSQKYVSANVTPKQQVDTWDDLQVEVVGGFYRSYEAKQFIKKLSNGDNVYFCRNLLILMTVMLLWSYLILGYILVI